MDSSLIDTIRDIKPPLYFKTSFLPFIILASILLIWLIVMLSRYIYEKFKKEKLAPSKIIRPPHEIAYEALEALRAKDHPSFGRVKIYYSELSNIVRHYIENRFSIKAPEMTTEEFLFSVRESGKISGSHKNLLKEFLILCDIVKFAKHDSSASEMGASFNAAKIFVDETKAIEKIPEEVSAK